jgi:uncharacterized protein YjdB
MASTMQSRSAISTYKSVKVTSVKLNMTKSTLTAGKKVTLTASVLPSNAKNKAVSWTSSNKKVASVKNGIITALKPGNAKITVTTADGKKKAVCTVTVKPNVKVTSVKLNKTKISLIVGKKETLAASVLPSAATNESVTWTSSNKKVASVKNGIVTALKPGNAKITVTTADGKKKAVCTVTVKPIVKVTSVKLNKTKTSLIVGRKETLAASVLPSNATNKSITWTSSNTSVATVKNGIVTAVKPGNAKIIVTTTDGKKQAVCTVTVNPVVKVISVNLSNNRTSLVAGVSDTFTAAISPSSATNKAVKWTTSDSSIAAVTSGGVVKPVKEGTATITAVTVDGSKSASCTVTVHKNAAVSFKDKKLEQVVRTAINKKTGTLYKGDVIKITELYADGMGITNLEGIQNLVNLKRLSLGVLTLNYVEYFDKMNFGDNRFNNISDISPLKSLVNLEYLNLDYNGYDNNERLKDLEPINSLKKLKELSVRGSDGMGLSYLIGLNNLRTLNISSSGLLDVSVLKKLTYLQSLDMSSCFVAKEDWDFLMSMRNLHTLKISGADLAYHNKLNILEKLSQLQALYLDNAGIKDISFLKGYKNLKQLSLNDNYISDLSVLKSLPKLELLALNHNKVSDVSDLKGLNNLRYLYLDWNEIKTISPLKGLTKLQKLDLGYNNIVDYSVLKGLTNLQYLWIRSSQTLDMNILKGLTKLQYLRLTGKVTNAGSLKGLVNLKYLYLWNPNLRDVSFIENFTKLEELSLYKMGHSGGSGLSNVSSLNKATKLRRLYMSYNNISDISSLSRLTNLQLLYLDSNNIKNISPLKNLKNLRLLDLSSNPVSQSDVKSLKNALPNCFVVTSEY